MDFFTQNRKALANYARMSQTIGARADYVQGGGGNTSVKLKDGLMAIKASGYCLKDVRPDAAYAVMDYEALRAFYYGCEPGDFPDVEKVGADKAKSVVVQVEGLAQLRPSVEAGFHSLLDTYVAHTHSVYANLATCTTACQAIAAAALADADYAWGFVPYTDPGVRLTFTIRDEIDRVRRAQGKKPSVIFMENHGVIVHDDDVERVLAIHTDVNARLAAAFGLAPDAFPQVVLTEADGMLEAATPYLAEAFKRCGFTDKDMIEDALYPDQMVFLTGQFHMEPDDTLPQEGCCTVGTKSGRVRFNMPAAKAQVVAETLTAVLFIREQIAKAGYTLSTMGEAAKSFIANWESEKYRKTLSDNKK